MHTIKNLTNSPYDLQLKDGSTVRLPAMGIIDGDFDPLYVKQMEALGIYEVREGGKPGVKQKGEVPVNRRKKATPDISKAEIEKEMAEIRQLLIDHEVKVDGRWLIKKLRSEKAKLEKKLATKKKVVKQAG